ncbi:DUF4255 domain-containing protein [Streptomyces sp. bgisy153]|uniref:DUF4255 domain-containing protein n=1 Tax=Streptomyces sp. bgisy153 TaxID=3413793 RepID=UPI003D711C7C
MSDALAVAAVTETLRAVLRDGVERAVPGAVVTVRHPGEAVTPAEAGTPGSLNVFLYRTSVDTAWRNTDPVGTRPGESRRPALPLVLHYLFTGHAPAGADSTVPERLIGAVMSALHDRPELRAADLRRAAGFSDLHLQQEPVRLTPAAPTAEELCRLWTALGHAYRLSVAYEARIVLIDSSLPGRAPLPVLRTGPTGAGPQAMPSAAGAWPVLRAVVPAHAAPGTDVVFTGGGLRAGTPTVRLTHPVLPPVVLPGRAEGSAGLRATLGADQGAGRWSATVVLTAPDGVERTTGPLTVTVAPRIKGTLPLTVRRDDRGVAVLNVDCVPTVHPGQRAELLVADRPVPAEPFARATRTLCFRLVARGPGRHPLRLRVDGVDSRLADGHAEGFDTDLAVVIT